MLTVGLTTRRGTSPTLYLTEDDADRLNAACEDDGGRFQYECQSDRGVFKLLTCFRFSDHVAIGIGRNADQMTANEDAAYAENGVAPTRWGLAIPLKLADDAMASVHPVVRFGGYPDGQHRR
jgi:hypothetical protein